MQSVKQAIFYIISIGPEKGMTTAEILKAYEGNLNTTKGGPETSYDALRGRVYELANEGWIRRAGKRKNERGQSVMVFAPYKKKAQVKATTSVVKPGVTCIYGFKNCSFCKTGTYAES